MAKDKTLTAVFKQNNQNQAIPVPTDTSNLIAANILYASVNAVLDKIDIFSLLVELDKPEVTRSYHTLILLKVLGDFFINNI